MEPLSAIYKNTFGKKSSARSVNFKRQFYIKVQAYLYCHLMWRMNGSTTGFNWISWTMKFVRDYSHCQSEGLKYLSMHALITKTCPRHRRPSISCQELVFLSGTDKEERSMWYLRNTYKLAEITAWRNLSQGTGKLVWGSRLGTQLSCSLP